MQPLQQANRLYAIPRRGAVERRAAVPIRDCSSRAGAVHGHLIKMRLQP